MKKPRQLSNHLLAVLACLLWSTAFVAVKRALTWQTPLNLAGMRFLLAGLLQLPLCGRLSAPFRLLREQPLTVLAVSFFHTVYLYGTFFLALQWVEGAHAAIIIGAGPLVTAVTAHLLMPGDRLDRQTALAIAFGLAGVTLVALSTHPWTPVGRRELGGILLLLSGSFVSALGNILVARRSKVLPPVALNSAQMLIGGPILLAIAFLAEGPPRLAVPPVFYGWLLWLSVISAAGFAIWFHLLGRMRVSRLNLWKFLIPLNGALLSWLLLPGESPSPAALAGMALILAALFIGRKEAPVPPAE